MILCHVRCGPARPFCGGVRQLHRACEWSINGLQSMSVDTNRPPKSQRSGSHDSSLVFIVDDDQGMRDALGSLLRSVGHRLRFFLRRRICCNANFRILSAASSAISRDEDDRNPDAGLSQLSLEIQATQSRQSDVKPRRLPRSKSSDPCSINILKERCVGGVMLTGCRECCVSVGYEHYT
jgi:hypothetical protein